MFFYGFFSVFNFNLFGLAVSIVNSLRDTQHQLTYAFRFLILIRYLIFPGSLNFNFSVSNFNSLFIFFPRFT